MITKDDIGKEMWDITDTEYQHGTIVAIDIKGRIICEFDCLDGEVFTIKPEAIVFSNPTTQGDGIIELNGVRYRKID